MHRQINPGPDQGVTGARHHCAYPLGTISLVADQEQEQDQDQEARGTRHEAFHIHHPVVPGPFMDPWGWGNCLMSQCRLDPITEKVSSHIELGEVGYPMNQCFSSCIVNSYIHAEVNPQSW